jgi:membrane-bound lytic murein transglycosylase B
MNALLLVFLLLAADDSPLVKAAKASGGPHKKTGKVITNADVKKAAAKPGTAASPAPATTPATDTQGPLEKQDEQRRARAAATERVANAEKKAAELEAELRRLEQAYYEESDLNRRDRVLVPRFEQTKKQLDEAKAELAAARDALSRLQ